MLTPTTALGWELWRRHGKRLMAIAGVLLAFAVIYPKLCALADFDPVGLEPSNEIGKKISPWLGQPPNALQVFQVLSILFLAGGPATAMILSLLYATWMFTFTENDPRTKDPLTFPARLFSLPVSTSFLFWRLSLGGLAGVVILYSSWVALVPLPSLEAFAPYQNGFYWMTLLMVTQGVAWGLAAWPKCRSLALVALLWGLLTVPAWKEYVGLPVLLPPLFLGGAWLARAGLQKMRHGQWQGWAWSWPWAGASRSAMRGPKRFASQAKAQLWFEWRRRERALCLGVAALALVPVILHVAARVVGRLGPVDDQTITCFAAYLIGIPLVSYFCAGVSPGRSDLNFLMARPLTNGQISMAILKATALGVVLSWAAALAALGGLPWLGDFHAAAQHVPEAALCRAALALGLMLFTWRMVAASLCFVLTGRARLARVPVWLFMGIYMGTFALLLLSKHTEYWDSFLRIVPGLLAGLVVLKLVLAAVGFRISVGRRLITPSSVVFYLVIWILIVAGGMALIGAVSHICALGVPVLTASLAIILVTPLARVGFCPIALAVNRHT